MTNDFAVYLLGQGGKTPSRWPPKNKLAPYTLPPITSSQTQAVWRSSQPFPDVPQGVPSGPDPRFFRERFNGVQIDGIPWFPGNYYEIPEIMMPWFLPWQERSWWDKYFEQYIDVWGLTHFRLSIPQARNWGFLDQRLHDCAHAAAQNGLYVCMNVWGGDGYEVENAANIQPHLDAMVKDLTWLNTVWQHDQHYDQVDTNSGLCPLDGLNNLLWTGLYGTRNGLLLSDHWMRDGGAWPDADDSPRTPYSTYTRYGISDRFNWAIALGAPDSPSSIGGSYLDRFCQWLGNDHREMSGKKYLHCNLMQYDTEAPMDGVQEALESVKKANAPVGIGTCLTEVEAQAQSFQSPFPPRTPECGNKKGFLGQCADSYDDPTWGYGDGGSYPSGDFL